MLTDEQLLEYQQKQLDDYFDPGKAWDRYCDEVECSYKAWYDEAVCGNCKHCEFPSRHMYTDPTVAYCPAWVNGFIHTTDTPAEWECEEAEPQ